LRRILRYLPLPNSSTTPGATTGDVEELGKGRYRRILRNQPFRRLWLSGMISGVGDWLVIGLLMPLVTQLSGGSSFAVAGILIAKLLPALLFSSLIGALVDLFDRRRVMIACDVIRAVSVLGLVLTNSLFLIYLVVFTTEIAALFFLPARNALIPHLVKDEKDVAAANGLVYTTQQSAMFFGLVASGAVLAVFEWVVRALLASDLPVLGRMVGVLAPELLGPRAGVFVDSFTFLISAALIFSMRLPETARREVRLGLKMVGEDMVESFRFLRDHRELRGFLVTVGLAILGGGAIVPVGLTHVQQNLVGGVPFLDQVPVVERLIATPQTFVLVFMALGMAVGALLVPRLETRVSLQALFLGGVAGFGASMLAFASVELYWLASIFAVGTGLGVSTVSVAGYTYVHATVDDSIRGRVFTALESVVRVALLVSLTITAPLADLMNLIVRDLVEKRGIIPDNVVLTGSRLTLQLMSLVVLAAAYYAYRNLDWRGGSRDGTRDGTRDGMGASAEEATEDAGT
jgi:dTMP kinase